MESANQCRQHMAVCRMVVIIRTIKIRRHDRYIIRPILPIQELTILQPRNFCQCISFISFFQRRSQQTALFHRLRGKTWINAGRSQKLQFSDAILPSRMDDIHLQHHVLIHEISQSLCICLDSAHFGSSQEYILWFLLPEKVFYLLLTAEVQFLMRPRDDVVISLAFQLPDNGGSHHTTMPGYINLCFFFHHSETHLSKIISIMSAILKYPESLYEKMRPTSQWITGYAPSGNHGQKR